MQQTKCLWLHTPPWSQHFHIRCLKKRLPLWTSQLTAASNICQANAGMITTAARTRGTAVMPRCSLKPRVTQCEQKAMRFFQGHKLVAEQFNNKTKILKIKNFAKFDPQMLEYLFDLNLVHVSVPIWHTNIHWLFIIPFAQHALAAFPY